MKLEMKETATEFLFFVNDETAARIKKQTDRFDSFVFHEGDVVEWTCKTAKETDHMCMELEDCFEAKHIVVPAVSYDQNPWGKDHEYKGLEKDGIPYSFAYHRTAVPGATVSKGNRVSLAVCSSDTASGSMFIQNKKAVHRLIWPETESPQYLMADCFMLEYIGKIKPRCEFKGWIFFSDQCDADEKMMLYIWKQNIKRLHPKQSAQTIWDWSVEYAKKLYTHDGEIHAFNIGFRWDGNEWVKREEMKYEIGWCGQNASLAVSLLYDYQMNGNKDSLKKGLAVLDWWTQKARSKEGLLLTRYDPEDSLIDACNLGTAGCQLIEAYEQCERIGVRRTQYLTAALEICDFAMAHQRLDGGIAMSWNRDGSVHTLEGTAGAFLILPIVKAFEKTHKEKYNIAAVRAYSYYFREFKNCGYGTSGALDTCCIDKESVIPLLKGGIMLYEATGFERYLKMAQKAAWYLSTWQWHQSVVYPSDSILGKMGYDTFGGTAVSTSHHHIDPFALCYVEDLKKLAIFTKNTQWESRAFAIWYNASQGISDGTLMIGETGVRPRGSCDEGILHTRWGNNGNYFGVSQWLVAWPCAFRLEVLRKLDNWNWLNGEEQEAWL